ncbi:hypothetical protein Q5H91_04245 [Sphingomonas sp. KR1UV-12]|uniref:XRE family transcriptional regulator n=1 Tax=Sphingomonas aurea TaxID=3063994 RepID=A0ABT9EHY3_9SPHN|nr:hypothetical protein [Sphingomonas sp. KR1UV-12]MDP1026413.1 hypothetical protein [Sphingomonas sp. KR1UV-12]
MPTTAKPARHYSPFGHRPPADPRAALAAIVATGPDSYAELSRMLRRPDHYLRRFVVEGHPRALRVDEHARLAAFFGLSERQLGIRDLWLPPA